MMFRIIGLLLVIAAMAFGQIRLNAWNQPFYNALQRRDLHGFLVQLVIFCIIAGAPLGPECSADLAKPSDQG